MPLSLRTDGARWRAHLRAVVDSHPGLVPVIKGNGYGLGLASLARRAAWLGVDMVAVGTYDEVPAVLDRFDGDVLVLSPYRPFLPGPTYDEGGKDARRVLHTVGRLDDLRALAAAAATTRPRARLDEVTTPGGSAPANRPRARLDEVTTRGGSARADPPRVVLEALTSMRRHGFSRTELGEAVQIGGVRVEGLALHLPMTGDRVAEVEFWLAATPAIAPMRCIFVSHVTDTELRELATRDPDVMLRPRIGTALWLGDRGCFSVRSTVLDVHPVSRGDRVGYRQRRIPRDGHLLVLAGGTAHGLGLEAPASGASLRNRGLALARGGLYAAGIALSPFVVAGRRRWFVEPPHMQASLVFLPAPAPPPTVGEDVPVRVRYTTAHFDQVTIT